MFDFSYSYYLGVNAADTKKSSSRDCLTIVLYSADCHS